MHAKMSTLISKLVFCVIIVTVFFIYVIETLKAIPHD